MPTALMITEIVLRAIKAECLRHPTVETGGVLLGNRVGTDYVVPAVIPPGPRSRRARTLFSPDTDFQQPILDFAHEYFNGLNYKGEWHRHPGQNDYPSAKDLSTAREILSSPEWDISEAVFPIAIVDDGEVRIRAYEITRDDPHFREIPLSVLPASDPRLTAALGLQPSEATGTLLTTAQLVRDASVRATATDVYGLARRDEHLLQLLSLHSDYSGSLQAVGRLATGKSTDDVGIPLVAGDSHTSFLAPDTLPTPTNIEVIDTGAEMAARRIGLVEEHQVASKRVAVFGVGSLGSGLALLLAQAGVGHFDVYDCGRLDAANLSRHACDLFDLGRSKALAVSELLRRRTAQAQGHDVDLSTIDDLESLVDPSDLLIATTDSPEVQFRLNEASVKTGTPGIFVGAYEQATAGEVIVVRPGGPCFFCSVGFRADIGPDLTPKERRQAYADANSRQLNAEPGLGTDISYLSSVAASFALAILDPTGRRDVLTEPNRQFTLVHGGSRPSGQHADLFDKPFDLVSARVVRKTPCEICGFQSEGK